MLLAQQAKLILINYCNYKVSKYESLHSNNNTLLSVQTNYAYVFKTYMITQHTVSIM
jgi:hypothetical protein